MRKRIVLTVACGLALVAACGGGGSSQTDGGADANHDSTQIDGNLPEDVGPRDAAPDTGGSSFDNAVTITVDGDFVGGALPNPATSKVYFKFTGAAGDRVAIVTKAEVGADPFDSKYLDLVVTLYDSTRTARAAQDSPWPWVSQDPELYTVLPAAGDYYLTVQECNAAWAGNYRDGGWFGCSAPTDVTHFGFQIAVLKVASRAAPTPILEGPTDQDGTVGSAIPITYASSGWVDGGTGGHQFVPALIGGAFQSATDVDAYSFTPPADLAVGPGHRARAGFYLQIPGYAASWGIPMGNGSTSPMKAWIVDSADSSGKHLAEVDQANSVGTEWTDNPVELSVPVQLGHLYYLFVQHGAGAAGANDFYYLLHAARYYYGPVETDDTGNNTRATAETLVAEPGGTTVLTYGVDGDLNPAGTDVDFYAVAVATGMNQATVTCGAQRVGSGLRGLTFSLLQSDGTPITGGTGTETAAADLVVQKITLPTAPTTVILKVEAASQDANVTSTSYRCQVQVR